MFYSSLTEMSMSPKWPVKCWLRCHSPLTVTVCYDIFMGLIRPWTCRPILCSFVIETIPHTLHRFIVCSQDTVAIMMKLMNLAPRRHWRKSCQVLKLGAFEASDMAVFLARRSLICQHSAYYCGSRFLPARRYASAGNRDRNVSVRLSVRLSRAGIVSKQRKLAAWFLHRLIAQSL